MQIGDVISWSHRSLQRLASRDLASAYKLYLAVWMSTSMSYTHPILELELQWSLSRLRWDGWAPLTLFQLVS